MSERQLAEAVRGLLDSSQPPDGRGRAVLEQVVREGRSDLLATILRAPAATYGPLLATLLGPSEGSADPDLDRRAGVSLALSLGNARLLERFTRHVETHHADDEVNLERLRSQQAIEARYERLLEEPDAAALTAARDADEGWFVGLLRRCSQRKSPPRLLAALLPLGFDPGFEGWIRAVFEALGEVREIRPAIAGWLEDEAASRGWADRLLHTIVTWAVERHAPQAPTAALLLATPVWRASAQELVLDQLAHGSMVLDGPGRAVLSSLGLSRKVIRALEAYAERSSRLAREEAAVEMAERFRRQTQQQMERLFPHLHRVWAELTLALPKLPDDQRHHHLRMRGALDDIMRELRVEPFGEPDQRVPYRLEIHRYIGHDRPPPPEAPVRIIEPGLRQLAEGGKFRIVRKALVT